ncbi:MAG: hypothetical protein U5J98_10025 [Halobacteriales archaeon]|nr:hypothetical protein [Halobacteriales archaeon]
MASTALISTVVMGAVLLGVTALVLRSRPWQHPASTLSVDTVPVSKVNGPMGWSVAFFAVTIAVMLLAVFYAGGEPVAGLEPAALGLWLAVSLALIVGGALVVAAYGALKSRGLNNAQSAAVSTTLFFTLFLIAIVVQLFVGG